MNRVGLMAMALVRAVCVSAALRRPVDIDALLAGDYDDVAVDAASRSPEGESAGIQ